MKLPFYKQHRYTNIFQKNGWKIAKKNCKNVVPTHKQDSKLKINTKYTLISKITCNDFYWHIIDK